MAKVDRCCPHDVNEKLAERIIHRFALYFISCLETRKNNKSKMITHTCLMKLSGYLFKHEYRASDSLGTWELKVFYLYDFQVSFKKTIFKDIKLCSFLRDLASIDYVNICETFVMKVCYFHDIQPTFSFRLEIDLQYTKS